MKKLLFQIIIILLVSCNEEDITVNSTNIFTGDVELLTQLEVESFGSNNYTEITGDLTIGDIDFITDINDLEPLSDLESVGNLYISVDDLTDFNGLHNLTTVNGYFYLRSVNRNMNDFEGLNSLSEINGSFGIIRSNFNSLTGLENLNVVNGNFDILSGYSLTSFSGFQLTEIGGDFKIIDCDLLTNLSGIETLTSISENLVIQENNNLVSLNGLQNLVYTNVIVIGGETQAGWDANNNLLSNFCDLSNLFGNGTYSNVIISNNRYNPTPNDIVSNNCSL